MPANTSPIFGLTPKVSSLNLTAANTSRDGIGGGTLFTAGSNGARIDRLRFVPRGTNVQTVCRIFINNGADPTVASNNQLFDEITVPAATTTETAGQAVTSKEPGTYYAILPAGYRLLAILGTAVASGITVLAEGSDF